MSFCSVASSVKTPRGKPVASSRNDALFCEPETPRDKPVASDEWLRLILSSDELKAALKTGSAGWSNGNSL